MALYVVAQLTVLSVFTKLKFKPWAFDGSRWLGDEEPVMQRVILGYKEVF